jgi:hypothetical protein
MANERRHLSVNVPDARGLNPTRYVSTLTFPADQAAAILDFAADRIVKRARAGLSVDQSYVDLMLWNGARAADGHNQIIP